MGKMDGLRSQLKEKMSSGGFSQVLVARATRIDQGIISHFLNDPDYGLGGKNALRLTEWIKGQEGSAATTGVEEEKLTARIRDLEARISDKDEIIALLKKHVAMLEGSERNAFKAEIFQYVTMLAEIAGREGRTLADIVGFHWSDLPQLSSEEREALWQVTKSALSKHPEFSRDHPHTGMEWTPLLSIPHNKKQLILASLDTAQKMIYNLRHAADTLNGDDTPFDPEGGTRTT